MSKLTDTGEKFKNSNPEGFKKLTEAMRKSNGKVNNMVGLILSAVGATTVDDVVKVATEMGKDEDKLADILQPIVGYYYNDKAWGVKSGRTKHEIQKEREYLRKTRFENGFCYTFEDTFLYRTMERLGLASKLEKECGWSNERTKYKVNNGNTAYGYGRIENSPYVQPIVMFYNTPKNLREMIISDENLNKMWTEQAKIQRTVYRPHNRQDAISCTDEEWRKFQTTHIIKEFDQLAHMPADKKAELNKFIEWNEEPNRIRYYGEGKLPPIVMHTILEGFKCPGEDKNIELIREAYEVMEYIGVGVCWNYVESVQFESNDDGTIKYDENGKEVKKYVFRRANRKEMPYKVGAMLRHISSSMRKFAADVRKGFDVRDVRELVVEDLNNWALAQTRGHWQFYVRDDAPEEYPDLQKKKKANKTKTENLELTETELAVVKQFEASKQERNNDGNEDNTSNES